MTPAVLVLAGLDPSGGAGLLADAEAIHAAGARPLGCATAITVQTARAVREVAPLEPRLVLAQARALLEEEPGIGAVKLGMLGSAAIAGAVATLPATVPWVIDPVLRASSGAALVDAAEAYRALLPLAAVVTPNLAEAGALAGRPAPDDEDGMRACGEALLAAGARAVLVKGGHLAGDAVDLLVTHTGTVRFAGPRLPGTRRGTGCRLASFLAARIAGGTPLETAVRDAKASVAAYLATGSHPASPVR